MTIDEVKVFIAENANDETVKTFIGELKKPSLDTVLPWLNTEEGKRALQPEFDRRVTQGIESYKQNHGAKTQAEINEMLKAKEDELRKTLTPQETAEQKEIREIKTELAKSKQEKLQAEIKGSFISELTKEGLNQDFAKSVTVSSLEEIPAKVTELKGLIELQVKKTVEETLKGSSVKPGSSNVKPGGASIEMYETELRTLQASGKRGPEALAQQIALSTKIQELKQKQE